MSTIKISTDLMNTALVINSSYNSGPFSSFGWSSPAYACLNSTGRDVRISLHSIVLDGSNTSGYPSNVGGKLVEWSLNGEWTSSGNIVTLDTPKSATATGTGMAVSFMIAGQYASYATGVKFIGNITAPGGGGALVLHNQNITAGDILQLGRLSFTFPLSYTY